MNSDADIGFVVGVLLTQPEQASVAVQSIGKLGVSDGVQVDVSVRREGRTVLEYAKTLQATYPHHHIILLDENVVVPSSFIESVRSQIQFFFERSVAWGVIGNAGVTFPYFKQIRNMLVVGAPTDQFAGVLPAAQLDAYVLIVHRDVRLEEFALTTGCPADAPIGDVATLAAWEAGRPCWICNLPVYFEGGPLGAQAIGDRDAWARYLAKYYNNTSFVSAHGTLFLVDHATDAKDFYYSQIEPSLNRATAHLDTASVTVFVFASYYDPDVFDRCLISIVSQFQRPKALYIIDLDRLDSARFDTIRAIVERYRHYLPIHWAAEDLAETRAIDQWKTYLGRVPDGDFCILAYDNCVLFPQAVRQICEFFQFTLRDTRVLPITTAEISRLLRGVETRLSLRSQVFFREVEKLGFTHKERWLSSEPTSTLHFTFPKAFLSATPLAGIDLFDLGSSLPQRLLAEPLSFYLIERGAGYMSFQKPSTNETVSPFIEAGTPYRLANKVAALLTAPSNVLHYALSADGAAPPAIWRDEGDSARQRQASLTELEVYRSQTEPELAFLRDLTKQQDARIAEFDAFRSQAEHELAGLRDLSQSQEASLNQFQNKWYVRARRRIRLPKMVVDLFSGER